MKPKFLVELDIFGDNDADFIKELECQELEYYPIKYCPFLDKQDWPIDPQSEECVITLGSINLIRQVQRQCRWVPGYWATWENYRYSTYVNYLSKYLLNDDFVILPYKLLLDNFEKFEDKLNLGSKGLFIKSDEGSKIFGGGVYYSAAEMKGYISSCRDETLCVVAPFCPIYSEFRFFVSGNEILDGSRYYNSQGKLSLVHPIDMMASELHEFLKAKEYLQQILSDVVWRPDLIFVADIGMTRYYPRLIEINSASCSGWYKASPAKIIPKMMELAAKEWEDLYGNVY